MNPQRLRTAPLCCSDMNSLTVASMVTLGAHSSGRAPIAHGVNTPLAQDLRKTGAGSCGNFVSKSIFFHTRPAASAACMSTHM